MTEPVYRFFVVDDDRVAVAATTRVLRGAGHHVDSATDSQGVVDRIAAAMPDCVLLDLMMPGLDGYAVCREIRGRPELSATKVIILTSKSYDFDRRQSRESGAAGFLTKPAPPEVLIREVTRIIRDTVALTYWGVRGTLPVPGPRSVRFGGNTSCVTLSFPSGALFIFDAGTGIKVLSDSLMARGAPRLKAHIFISHPHWDHINAFPFFAPLYIPGNEIAVLGAAHGDISMRQLISAQMDSIYFPVTMREFGAHVYFRNLEEEAIEVEGVRVRTKLLNHPGKCLGYRVDYNGRSMCYVTDNELFPSGHSGYNPHYRDELRAFVSGADVLISDACYSDAEYPRKQGWGHSSVGELVDFADTAGVRSLHLFHHDPDQTDEDIDAKLRFAAERLRERKSTTAVVAPREGDVVSL